MSGSRAGPGGAVRFRQGWRGARATSAAAGEWLAIDNTRVAVQLDVPQPAVTDPLRDPRRAEVVPVHHGYQLVRVEMSERPVAPGRRGLGGVPVAPGVPAESPADLEPWPALRLPEPAPAQEPIGHLLDDGVVGPAAQDAVADQEREVPPRVRAVQRRGAEELHDLSIGHHGGVRVEVVLDEWAE